MARTAPVLILYEMRFTVRIKIVALHIDRLAQTKISKWKHFKRNKYVPVTKFGYN